MKLCTIGVSMLPAPHRGLEETKRAIRMLVQARVTEAVVVVRVPQVVDDVTFQRGVGPYALVALVSRTVRLPANECGRDAPLLEDLVHVREVTRKLIRKVVALDARVVQAEQVPREAVQKEAAPLYLPRACSVSRDVGMTA